MKLQQNRIMSLSDKGQIKMEAVFEKMLDIASTKTSTGDEEKRHKFIKKLTTQAIQNFREIDIDEYDLNITQHFEMLEEIDDFVTPLIYCAYFGLKDICKVLLKNKQIDVDLETVNNKQTPLLTACICGNYQIARLLLLANAEVNKPNLLNHIPLTVTIFRLVEEPASFENKKICFRIAELLVKYGADVNWIIDKKNGYSLLHYFCSLKMKMNKIQKQLNFQIIKFLLEKGACVNQKSLDDRSCLDLLGGHCNKQQIANLLMEFKNKEVPSQKNQSKRIKRIDSDYFKLDAPKKI